jgi:hypothetical protein
MAIRTRHEWIHELSMESEAIAEMGIDGVLKDRELITDAFNLANCDDHRRLIIRVTQELAINSFSSKENLRNLLAGLIGRRTYGAFAELAAYDWLTRRHIRIATQVEMSSNDTLALSGATLDGRLEHSGAYFEVKAFGSNGRLAQRLKERLEEEIIDMQVLIEESWDLSFDTFQELIEAAPRIATELREKRWVQKGRMRIRIEPKKPVTVSMRSHAPYHLAEENALYPFVDAKQFTRNNPFILIFVVHPWFNGLSIHNDFGGVDTTFTRSLARRAFMQFSNDSTPLRSIAGEVSPDATFGDASRLLSAMLFINVWPKKPEDNATYQPPSWVYLNPRATHRIDSGSMGIFRTHETALYIDDFSGDDY